MSPRASATPLLDRLGELRAEARAARARLSELEAARSASVHRLDAARALLLDYEEAVGAGEREEDREEEARLLGAIREAEKLVSFRPMPALEGSGTVLVPVDEAAERRAYGALRAAQAAEAAVVTFQRVERDGLAGELAARAEAARQAQTVALPALVAAVDEDSRVRAEWRDLLRANGRDPNALPASPLRGFADDVPLDGVPLAVPAEFLEASAA